MQNRINYAVCFITLFIFMGISLISFAADPILNYGYAMFRDAPGDVVTSDGKGQYIDCHIGGEDRVQIYTNEDGSLNSIEFYPSKMYQDRPYPPSTRDVNFLFNISGLGDTPSNYAVRDILRWYKSGKEYIERCPGGYINDLSLHAPILVWPSYFGTDRIQFGIDPDPNSRGRDIKAITINYVWNYYKNDKNENYWYATDEPAKYVIYTIDYGCRFAIEAIDANTWRIYPPSGVHPTLYVNIGSHTGDKKINMNYGKELPFEIVVSLNPIGESHETTKPAPSKVKSCSLAWGEIKSR